MTNTTQKRSWRLMCDLAMMRALVTAGVARVQPERLIHHEYSSFPMCYQCLRCEIRAAHAFSTMAEIRMELQ